MNTILQTIAPLGKALLAILECSEAHLPEPPDAVVELAVEGEPQPGSFAAMKLTIEVEFVGPAEWAQCVLNSV